MILLLAHYLHNRSLDLASTDASAGGHQLKTQSSDFQDFPVQLRSESK